MIVKGFLPVPDSNFLVHWVLVACSGCTVVLTKAVQWEHWLRISFLGPRVPSVSYFPMGFIREVPDTIREFGPN